MRKEGIGNLILTRYMEDKRDGSKDCGKDKNYKSPNIVPEIFSNTQFKPNFGKTLNRRINLTCSLIVSFNTIQKPIIG